MKRPSYEVFRPLVYVLSVSLCQLFCWTIWRCRSGGRKNVPAQGAMLLLSNHESHLDPVVIACTCPRRLRCLARESLFVGPFGWWIRALGAIPIGESETTLSGLRTALKFLKEGEAMLIFPEGTRSSDGELGPLKPGFGALMKRRQLAVVPMAVEGAFEVWPKHRWLPRWGKTATWYGEPIPAEELAGKGDEEVTAIAAQHIEACRRAAAGLWRQQTNGMTEV
jgi:1-acyl-sn-glycerol-3-phosphate acyltransferase